MIKNSRPFLDDDKKNSVKSIIDAQVRRKLEMKRGRRKKIKALYERLTRRIYYRISCRSKTRVKPYDGSSRLGSDEFGRDIESGLLEYIELLKERGIQINTAIVLGSRAKGFWKPSSDVDVTIIGSNLPKRRDSFLVDRLLGLGSSDLLSDKPLCLGIEPSGCCSKEEFLRRMERFDIQTLDALYYGMVLYDDGFWRQAKEKFQKLTQQYKLDEAEVKRKLLPV